MNREEIIKNVNKIVIKIGTNVLTTKGNHLDIKRMKNIVAQVVDLMKKGRKIVMVSSGAIGCGQKELGFDEKVRKIPLRQACAAVGQNSLMYNYQNLFSKYNLKTAQLLLTYDTFVNRSTYLNLKNTFDELLQMGVVPIINENDPISVNEIDITFGDNDKLSALVATKLNADLLLILTDVDGLYDKHPNSSRALLIREVPEVTKEIEKLGGKPSKNGLGGMNSKVLAAKLAGEAGVATLLVNGFKKDIIKKVFRKEKLGTFFYPKHKISEKRIWLKNTRSTGAIIIDDGAARAMKAGKNLLAAGIIDISGTFSSGAVVDIKNHNKIFAKAISDYSSAELKKIKGKSTSEILKQFGKSYKNITKRENLVIL